MAQFLIDINDNCFYGDIKLSAIISIENDL